METQMNAYTITSDERNEIELTHLLHQLQKEKTGDKITYHPKPRGNVTLRKSAFSFHEKLKL